MSPRARFVVRRTLLSIPVLFAMSLFVFLMIHLIPGDPVRTMLGFRATPQNVAEIRQQLGLDDPLAVQYVHWLKGVLTGDLGIDYISRAPLSTLLAQRAPVTFELTILSMTVAFAIGVPLGVLAASRDGWVRRLSEGFVVFGITVPDFVLGILLSLIFAGFLRLLPPSGYVPFLEDPIQNLRYMVLPVLALGIGEGAYLLRTTRGAMEETLRSPFVLFLDARGIPRRAVVFRHALRNASVPIATVFGIQFGVLLGGAIVIENVFALPGIGRLLVTAIQQRNYLVVQSAVLLVAAMFIVVTLITDLVVGWLDPKVGEEQAA